MLEKKKEAKVLDFRILTDYILNLSKRLSFSTLVELELVASELC